MDNDIAISVEHVSKNFLLPHEKVSSVKGLFTNMARGRKMTKEIQHALKDIGFEIKKGEFFGIVGRNGSGKSTLLKILAGIYQPTHGKVVTHGKLVPFIELGVGFNPELSGRENVFLNGAMLGFSEKEVQAMYDDIVAFAELERFMDQKLKNYSSGMQVRLAFSMATRSEADILLVDEVLAVGDADFQRKCFEYFKLLKKNKKTVVFVSHDMEAVREYCDRAALIEKGKIATLGIANKTASQYSRLFFNNHEADDQSSNGKRWGTTTGIIQTVDVPASITAEQNLLGITAKLQTTSVLHQPVIGYLIKNSFGQVIAGSNTRLLGVDTGTHKPEEALSIDYQVQNIFSDGSYTVDIAVLDNDGVTVLDWWEEATHFKVTEEIPSKYLASPKTAVKVQKGA